LMVTKALIRARHLLKRVSLLIESNQKFDLEK